MELHTPLSQLVRGCASPRQTALASTAYPLPAGKDVFLNFGPVSSDAGPLRSRRSHRPSPWPPVPQPMPMLSG
ncbi:MobA/MobL family protein, partial [Bifidobacterium longum]